ncbi:MAG: hypothetical protein Q4B06_01490 [Candidatus Saccharibacteria bacterium]|nr:hypothetical protein [Candidatus Saccharibacteria bacterium]
MNLIVVSGCIFAVASVLNVYRHGHELLAHLQEYQHDTVVHSTKQRHALQKIFMNIAVLLLSCLLIADASNHVSIDAILCVAILFMLAERSSPPYHFVLIDNGGIEPTVCVLNASGQRITNPLLISHR